MSPSDTQVEQASPLSALSDRELLEAIFQQQANLAEQYTRVEALVTQTLTAVGPMLEKLSKNPMFKMLGLG